MFVSTYSTYVPNFRIFPRSAAEIWGGGGESAPPRTWNRQKSPALLGLKHKDSFGKSENLSKIFFAEILVFDHDYEGKSSSSNGLLWISFIFFKIIYLNYFTNCSEGLPNKSTRYQLYFCKV